MTEIKSTLDIIMEKAKKFSVTEEEKRGFKRHELEGKIKGLVRESLDGILDSEKFQAQVAALKEKEGDLVDQILIEEVVARMELGPNCEAPSKLLKSLAGPDWAGISKIPDQFKGKAEKEKGLRSGVLLESLRRKGISGSAVLPNVDGDPEWIQTRSEIKRQMQEEIRERLKALRRCLNARADRPEDGKDLV